jgi:uncharacterized protein (TIGR03000 family)
MTRQRVFLALPAVALACVLLVPETSFAQLRGWRGSGWSGSGYGGYNNYGGMYTPGTTWGGGYNGYGNPYGYGGNYYQPGYQGFQTMPYYGSNMQLDGGTGYANVVPSGDYQSFYPTQGNMQGMSQQGMGMQQGMDNNRARIHVRVPADAQVMFDNSPTRQMGSERNFVTPPLEGNFRYTYEISARWRDANGKERQENRTVRLTPGQTANVDFTASANTGSGHDGQLFDNGNQPGGNRPNPNNSTTNPDGTNRPNLNNPGSPNGNRPGTTPRTNPGTDLPR